MQYFKVVLTRTLSLSSKLDLKVGEKTLKLEKDSKIISLCCIYCLLVLPDDVGILPNHISTIRYPIFGMNKIQFFKKCVSTVIAPTPLIGML